MFLINAGVILLNKLSTICPKWFIGLLLKTPRDKECQNCGQIYFREIKMLVSWQMKFESLCYLNDLEVFIKLCIKRFTWALGLEMVMRRDCNGEWRVGIIGRSIWCEQHKCISVFVFWFKNFEFVGMWNWILKYLVSSYEIEFLKYKYWHLKK